MSNPYASSGKDRYEMSSYPAKQEDDFVSFMQEMHQIGASLDGYSDLINMIARNQRDLLQDLDLNDEESQLSLRRVDSLVADAQALQLSLKARIKNAQQLAANHRDHTMMDQAEQARKRFLDLIQEYRMVESRNREQTRTQAERQYKIIKPHATDAEIKQVVEGGDLSQQLFQQELMQSNRRGEARVALNEVQLRHKEFLKLEKTMAELTQLFNDMEELVIEQDQAIQQIDEQVDAAQHDIEQGVGHTNKAVVSARASRKKRKWIFFICLVIICIIALALGLKYGLPQKK